MNCFEECSLKFLTNLINVTDFNTILGINLTREIASIMKDQLNKNYKIFNSHHYQALNLRKFACFFQFNTFYKYLKSLS